MSTNETQPHSTNPASQTTSGLQALAEAQQRWPGPDERVVDAAEYIQHGFVAGARWAAAQAWDEATRAADTAWCKRIGWAASSANPDRADYPPETVNPYRATAEAT